MLFVVLIFSQVLVLVSILLFINISLNINERILQSDFIFFIYEVKFEIVVKDVIMEKIDIINIILEKGCKVELKCDRVKVENGDDDIIIVENVIIMIEIEE